MLLLAGWMIGAVVIHDGVLSPLIVLVGALLARVPPRARRYLQSGLIVGALVTVIALPLVARQGTQPRAKALLLRDYGANLAILLGLLAAVSLLAYAVHVVRDGRSRHGRGRSLMGEPRLAPRHAPSPARTAPVRWANRALVAGLAVVAAAFIVPAVFQWHVHADAFAPLSADWQPRFGIGTVPAVAIGIAVVARGISAAQWLRWPALLAGSFALSLAWMLSLALVDGSAGIGAVFENRNESLRTAHHVGDVSTLLHTFLARIPAGSPGSWPTHVAGHPPGSLLFFVALVHLGLGGGFAAGLVVTVVAATTPVAVLLTLDRLGARPAARRVAPFLAVGPFAIWSAVSLDALIAAVLAWSMYVLSRAATSPRSTDSAHVGSVRGAALRRCPHALLRHGGRGPAARRRPRRRSHVASCACGSRGRADRGRRVRGRGIPLVGGVAGATCALLRGHRRRPAGDVLAVG